MTKILENVAITLVILLLLSPGIVGLIDGYFYFLFDQTLLIKEWTIGKSMVAGISLYIGYLVASFLIDIN